MKIAREKSSIDKHRPTKEEIVRRYNQKIGRQTRKEQATGLE